MDRTLICKHESLLKMSFPQRRESRDIPGWTPAFAGVTDWYRIRCVVSYNDIVSNHNAKVLIRVYIDLTGVHGNYM